MNRPIPSNSAANIARKSEETQQLAPEKAAQEYAQKLKLAQHLHDQGINPERWTEAEPAAWATQKAFRETGRKPDDRHFEIEGRLYKSTPAVAANQAQGQDALDVYLGAVAKPVEQLVDVTKVPLQHPLGRPHTPRPDSAKAHALNLHYAKVGIDPAKAHDGDPLPMPMQQRLQQITRAADGSEIPLGIPGIYRGYDDGYFYAVNEGTAESPETQQLRRDLATAKADRLGDAAPIAANDNDPEIDEAVARSYLENARLRQAAEAEKKDPHADNANAGQIDESEQSAAISDASAAPAIFGSTIALPAMGEATALAEARTIQTLISAATTTAAPVAALAGAILAATTTSTAGPELDETTSLYQMPKGIDTKASPINDNYPNSIQSTQVSASPSSSNSSLKRLLAENYQTYSSLIAKLRKGESLNDDEARLSKEIVSKFDESEAAIAAGPQTTETIAVETPNIQDETIPVGLAVAPGIKQWLFNLLRGKPDEDAQPDRDEAYEFCSDLCTGIYENNPDALPGEGSDMAGRWRRCVRDCMEDHGYSDF